MLKYETFIEQDSIQVNLIGDLDIDSTEAIQEELIPALMEYENINLNFENVPFVDSSGMGLLIEIVKKVRVAERTVVITKVNKDVKEVFDLLQIEDILGKEVFSGRAF